MKVDPLFAKWPSGPLLRVFYDGSCALCCAEMAEIKRLDAHQELELLDCAAPGFDDSAYRAEGVSRADMMQALHVRDILGDWHRGVDAFGLLYASVGAPLLARLWAHPWTRPFTKRLYPWLARNRYALSALGLNWVAPKVLRLLAWRSAHRPRCAHGACELPLADGAPQTTAL